MGSVYFGDFFLGAVAAIMVLAIIIIATQPGHNPTEAELCEMHGLEFAGLEACAIAPLCQMGDDEVFARYKARKGMLMHCARATYIDLLEEAEKDKDVQTDEEEGPSDDDLTAQNGP